MNAITREELAEYLKTLRINKRLVRELRFTPEAINAWDDRELLAISTRSNIEGVLLIETASRHLIPYTLSGGLTDAATGRSKAAICDFCFTWQGGGKSKRISFVRTSDGHSLTYICCGDLQCSLHVRGRTPEATLSRSQLREDITEAQRIVRLRQKLNALVETLGAGKL